LDLCQYSINYCRQNHSDQIDFWVGDAEALPFSDGLADVVFNLESSHAYPNKEQFYKEVFRVLKPGGFFLYSDSLPSSAYFAIENYLQELGFELLFRQDITANVLLSCDRIAATREMALSNIINKEEQKALSDFVATPDSEVYQNMSSGKWLYKILRLQKVA
jgi:ubiquinone/menaquinone biosynthesis C-methylase UbiE